jgi:surfactin synthase thioesterase subunit
VFCFPHVGGGTTFYNTWLQHLPPHAELCAIRLPGRESRQGEPFIEDMDTLIGILVDATDALMDRPYVLFGHCSGSLMAYYFARRMMAEGRRMPSHLIVTSVAAPSTPATSDPIHVLPRDELISRFVAYGGVAPEILADDDLIEVFEPVIRADSALIEQVKHLPGPPLDVPLTVISGLDDPFLDFEALAAWRHETTANFSLRLEHAGHFVVDESAAIVASLLPGAGELVR